MYASHHVPLVELPTELGAPSARRAAPLHPLRLLTVVGLSVFLGFLGLAIFQGARAQTELLAHRAFVQELAGALRALRPLAASTGRPVRLRVDETQGNLQVSILQGAAYETVRQVLWLPEGLSIVEAPMQVTIQPRAAVPSTSLVFTAPTHRRLFRLRLNADGSVPVHEEPTA